MAINLTVVEPLATDHTSLDGAAGFTELGPQLMAATLWRKAVHSWAADRDIKVMRSKKVTAMAAALTPSPTGKTWLQQRSSSDPAAYA